MAGFKEVQVGDPVRVWGDVFAHTNDDGDAVDVVPVGRRVVVFGTFVSVTDGRVQVHVPERTWECDSRDVEVV